MPDLFEFMQMTERERISYVQAHGLTKRQRQELLRMNEMIATLIQQDAFWKHQRENLKITILKKW